MTEKNYVGMVAKICPICGKKEESGEILIDKRMRKSLDRLQVTGFGNCKDCQKNIDNGFIALIGCNNVGVTGNIKFDEADRSGNIAFLKREVFSKVFNVETPKNEFVFVEQKVLTDLEQMREERQ